MSDEEDEPRPPEDTPEDDDVGSRPQPGSLGPTGIPPSAFQAFAQRYSKMLGDLYSPRLNRLAASLAPDVTNVLANVVPQVRVPTISTDPTELGKAFAKIVQKQQISSAALAAKAIHQQREQWDSLFSSLRALVESLLPANWKGVKHPGVRTIESILLDEGIPLAWIPGPDTLQAILDAPSAAKRRQLIGRRWKRVVVDCASALAEVDHPNLQRHRPFSDDIVRALREGHISAAQALAANLLDSILRRNFDTNSFRKVTTNKKIGKRFDLDAYQIRVAFTLGPIWRAYGEYWENQGDSIPRSFGRHPSAHAVSRTQYSRVNAVIGLMLVTSLLKLLDHELAR